MTGQVEAGGQPGSITSTDGDTWFRKFFGKISDQLQDLTYVDVLTVSSGDVFINIDTKAPDIKDELKKNRFKILAETKIELDGDIVLVLPMSDSEGKINKEVLDIHKENVAIAVQNWNNVLRMIVEIIRAFAGFAGLKETDIFDKFMVDTQVK
jgi:hypothetical protein